MPKVSDEHKDGVRRRIMDAALVCLQRNGFQDVTTRDLLQEAGLSTGTFYNYFPSKDHLYEALAEELLAVDIAQIIDDTRPLGTSLLVFLRDFMLVQPEGAVPLASFRNRASVSPEGAEAVDRLNRFLQASFVPLVRTAQADGVIRPELDAEAFVELMDIIYDGMGRRAAADSFQTSYERVGAAFLHVLAHRAVTDGIDLQRGTVIHHIADRFEWEAAVAVGEYRRSTREQTLEEVGFIHCSTAAQVPDTLARFYVGADDLVVLTIDPERVRSEVRYENTHGGTELFPHLYGPLPVAAVVEVIPVPSS